MDVMWFQKKEICCIVLCCMDVYVQACEALVFVSERACPHVTITHPPTHTYYLDTHSTCNSSTAWCTSHTINHFHLYGCIALGSDDITDPILGSKIVQAALTGIVLA